MTLAEKSAFLRAAVADAALVRFSTRFEPQMFHGYVLSVSERFLILATVNDQILLDGYQCFRLSDLRALRLDPYAGFIEAALKARGEVVRPCAVDVTDIATLLTTAGAAFPLVTIHEERIYPDECRIGRLLSVERGIVALREISPHASWHEEPTRHRLRDITRVDFDGGYERALQLVGGVN